MGTSTKRSIESFDEESFDIPNLGDVEEKKVEVGGGGKKVKEEEEEEEEEEEDYSDDSYDESFDLP